MQYKEEDKRRWRELLRKNKEERERKRKEYENKIKQDAIERN